jgi:hypothetical protein
LYFGDPTADARRMEHFRLRQPAPSPRRPRSTLAVGFARASLITGLVALVLSFIGLVFLAATFGNWRAERTFGRPELAIEASVGAQAPWEG